MTTKTDKETIRETVKETLLALGIDTSDSEAIINFQKDMHFTRAARIRSASMVNNGINHGFIMLLSAIGAAVILGAAQAMGFTVRN